MNSEIAADTISVRNLAELVKRNLFTLAMSVVIAVGLAMLAAYYVPKKFKSKAVLTIQSSYFQHPLVSDVVSEIQDPSEMNSQRLSLLRLALNDRFLDTLGEKYKLYEHPAGSRLRSLDRELFLKRIEYFSISPSTFQVSIVTPEASSAYAAAQDVLAQMTNTLIEQRYQQLVQAQQAILKQAKLLNATLSTTSSAPQIEDLQNKLATMETNLSSLRSRFTETHPDVLRLKGATRALESHIQRLEIKPGSENVDDYTRVFLSPSSRTTSQEIFDDLLKKLSHLNVVLEMEKDRANVSYLGVIELPTLPLKPYFPDPLQFIIGGVLAGIVFSLIIILTSELKRSNRISPVQIESYFGFELLGELPAFSRGERKLLFLEDPTKGFVALPLTSRED